MKENKNIKFGFKKFSQMHDDLHYLFKALKEKDDKQKIDKAISLLHEVEMNQICHCLVPKPKIPLQLNQCEKCGKKLIIE